MEDHPPFPYVRILSVVLLSVLVTAILFWVWHLVEMGTLKSAHTKQNDSIRSEITVLRAHIATFGTTTVAEH